jgi:hypothetical protein
MIELLLQAERALGMGLLDQAERLYWQAIDGDGQNAIAIVGLAKVARQRGDDRTAMAFGRQALALDGENAVAIRLVAEVATSMRAPTVEGRAADPPTASGATDGTDAPTAAAPASAAPAEATPPTVRSRADIEWPAADIGVRPPAEP